MIDNEYLNNFDLTAKPRQADLQQRWGPNDRCFVAAAGPRMWNSLPAGQRDIG